ncbi:MAG: cell envelope integrity protein TolA [Gallionella sp.]|nr:cell envelope integrity protein TolA [Gallionella sp.]
MSSTVHHEPHRVSAGILAFAVHSLFFALLYFGLNWNRQAYLPATMSVQLWSSLPDDTVAPAAAPRIEAIAPPHPEKIPQPDIVIPEKKKPVPVPPQAPEPEHKKPVQQAAKVVKRRPEKAKAPKLSEKAIRMAEQQAALQKAEQARQAAQAAAIGQIVDEYQAKIQAKIRRNIFMPPNVPKDARAEFMVTLLPGGSVLSAERVKSSGNEAYDSAVERAILKSDPLPVPPDVTLFNHFRKLDLKFKPTE